jgi:hypothetical protein
MKLSYKKNKEYFPWQKDLLLRAKTGFGQFL